MVHNIFKLIKCTEKKRTNNRNVVNEAVKRSIDFIILFFFSVSLVEIDDKLMIYLIAV